MKPPPYLQKMASGDMAIVLEGGIDYDSFATAAERWALKLRLKITRRIDGPGERIWNCQRDGCRFWLAFDDWFPELSLEPQDHAAGRLIPMIAAEVGVNESEIAELELLPMESQPPGDSWLRCVWNWCRGR